MTWDLHEVIIGGSIDIILHHCNLVLDVQILL